MQFVKAADKPLVPPVTDCEARPGARVWFRAPQDGFWWRGVWRDKQIAKLTTMLPCAKDKIVL